MNQRGSSGEGGAARDVEPERCRLVGTDFLGAIIVAVGYKYAKKKKKKKNTPNKSRRRRGIQKTSGGKKWTVVGIHKAPEYESLHCGEGPYAAVKPYFTAA